MKKTAIANNPTEYSWQERALTAEAQLAEVLRRLDDLEAQIRRLTAARHGRSSGKTNRDQLRLF